MHEGVTNGGWTFVEEIGDNEEAVSATCR